MLTAVGLPWRVDLLTRLICVPLGDSSQPHDHDFDSVQYCSRRAVIHADSGPARRRCPLRPPQLRWPHSDRTARSWLTPAGCDRRPLADLYLVRRKPTLVSCLPYRSQTAVFPDFDTSRVIVSETDRTTWVTSGMRTLLS